jgi:hypothetical protein
MKKYHRDIHPLKEASLMECLGILSLFGLVALLITLVCQGG